MFSRVKQSDIVKQLDYQKRKKKLITYWTIGLKMKSYSHIIHVFILEMFLHQCMLSMIH